MKATLINRRLTLASVAFASIALATGCCTKHTSSQTHFYSSTPSATGASAPAQEYTYSQPSGEISTSNGTNTVIPLYKEQVNIGKREVDNGSVTVKKIVKTETINQPVELRREEIVVERQPGTGQVMDTTQAFQEGETTVHLTREEPVITKETTSAGQVVLRTTSSTDQTTVKATARSEDVAVTKNGEGVTVQGMGAAESPSGQSAGASSSGTITSPSMLSTSEDPSSFNGRSVEFSNLRVQNVVGDNVALLSTGTGQTIYAYISQGAGSLKPGDNVNVSGTVKTGAASSLSGDAAHVLSSQPMYIDAQKIEAAP